MAVTAGSEKWSEGHASTKFTVATRKKDVWQFASEKEAEAYLGLDAHHILVLLLGHCFR